MFIEKTGYVVVVYRIKIPGIHFQDQKYRNGNILTITELMKQCHKRCKTMYNKE
jgi:hypothetical protein